MKIKVISKAFYKGELLNEGRIIEFKEKKLPSWAEKLNEKKDDPVAAEHNDSNDKINAAIVMEHNDSSEKEEAELLEILDALITKAVEKGLTIDVSELHPKEAINLIKKELGE